MAFKVAGLDPGPEYSALVVLSPGGAILKGEKLPNKSLLKVLADAQPMQLAIETLQSFGMPVGAEVFNTAIWVGRYIQLAETAGHAWQLVKRTEVKLHHCGTVRAKDADIRRQMIQKFGAPGTKKNPGATFGITGDIWSALAIAEYARSTVWRI